MKQRILFRRKAKPALREALLNEAVRRLGWSRDVSSLYERDAFVCVKEKTFPAAYKKLSLRNVIPSQMGSNVVSVLEFTANDKARRGDSRKIAVTLLDIDRFDHALASPLADKLCKSAKGESLALMAVAAADIAARAEEVPRASEFFEMALDATGDRVERQRLRYRYAQFLESVGRTKRCAEVYDDMLADIREDDVYAAPMKRCIGFLPIPGKAKRLCLCWTSTATQTPGYMITESSRLFAPGSIRPRVGRRLWQLTPMDGSRFQRQRLSPAKDATETLRNCCTRSCRGIPEKSRRPLFSISRNANAPCTSSRWRSMHWTPSCRRLAKISS